MGHYLFVFAALLMAVESRHSFSQTCQGIPGLGFWAAELHRLLEAIGINDCFP
jgi:hypothetical protein